MKKRILEGFIEDRTPYYQIMLSYDDEDDYEELDEYFLTRNEAENRINTNKSEFESYYQPDKNGCVMICYFTYNNKYEEYEMVDSDCYLSVNTLTNNMKKFWTILDDVTSHFNIDARGYNTKMINSEKYVLRIKDHRAKYKYQDGDYYISFVLLRPNEDLTYRTNLDEVYNEHIIKIDYENTESEETERIIKLITDKINEYNPNYFKDTDEESI